MQVQTESHYFDVRKFFTFWTSENNAGWFQEIKETNGLLQFKSYKLKSLLNNYDPIKMFYPAVETVWMLMLLYESFNNNNNSKNNIKYSIIRILLRLVMVVLLDNSIGAVWPPSLWHKQKILHTPNHLHLFWPLQTNKFDPGVLFFFWFFF